MGLIFLDLNPCLHHSPCANNGNCTNDGNGGYNCTCPSGVTGTDCDTDINECLEDTHLCLNNATCVVSQSPFDLAAADKSRLFSAAAAGYNNLQSSYPAAAAASWFNSAYPGYSGSGTSEGGQQTHLQSSKMNSEPSSTPSPSLPTPPPEPTKDQSFTPPALPVSASSGFNSFYSSLYNTSKPAGSSSSTSPSQAPTSSFTGYGSSLQQPNYSLPSLDQLRRPMPMLF